MIKEAYILEEKEQRLRDEIEALRELLEDEKTDHYWAVTRIAAKIARKEAKLNDLIADILAIDIAAEAFEKAGRDKS